MLDLLILFCASAGLILMGWLILGLLMRPVFCENMVTALPVSGDAERVERQVRSFAWYRDGRFSGGSLILVDCGLSEQGRKAVGLLQKQYPWLQICMKEEIRTGS